LTYLSSLEKLQYKITLFNRYITTTILRFIYTILFSTMDAYFQTGNQAYIETNGNN